MDATTGVDDIPFVPERGFYQPSTEETWEAYQALLSVVEYQSKANLPRAVLCGVADEVLSVLKSNTIKTLSDKKAEIERILNPFPDFMFDQLLSTAKLITDYYAVFVSENDFYQPRRDDTRGAYKLLLDFVNAQFGYDQPQMVMCILTHEVLVTLKDSSIEGYLKRQMIENTLSVMSDDKFDTLLSIAQLITDFNSDGVDVGAENELYHGDQNSNFPGFQYDRAGDMNEDEPINPMYDSDKVHYIGSSSTVIKDEYSSSEEEEEEEEDTMCIAFEKVHIAEQEDEEDWVMVDSDGGV